MAYGLSPTVSPFSWNMGAPSYNAFASNLGSGLGSNWDNLSGSFNLDNYNQPLNYDLSSGISSPNVLPNAAGAGTGLNFNWGNIGGTLLGVGNLIGSIGGVYNGIQANKLAKQQFNFMKDITNTQLNNSIKDYNTKLAGKYRSQSYYETGHDGAFDDLYEKNKLTR